MLIAASIITLVSAPIMVASAGFSKLYSYITGIQPVDVSRESFLIEISKYMRCNTRGGITSQWVCGEKVHVLCRNASIFSNYPPIVIIHGTRSCSFNYLEFMTSLPKTYDVYCIDLPGWGISQDPLIDLANIELNQMYVFYAKIIIDALTEIHPSKDAKFTLVGHSLGSFLLLKSIKSIPLDRVNKLVFACLPGIIPQTSRYPYFFATYFVYEFESIFKQWWSRHLFCAFLYRQRTQLETLKRMHSFIPNGFGYKIVGRHTPFRGFLPPVWISPIKAELDAYNHVQIDLINGSKDILVDIRPARAIINKTLIQLHELEGVGHMVFSQKELFQRLLTIIDDDNN